MILSAFHLMRGQPARVALTVGGISFSLLLMGFLLALYRGVEKGSVAYLRATRADAWMMQAHTTNILRGFSVLTAAHGHLARELEEVAEVSPVLFRLSSIETARGPATVYIVGYDVAAAMGGPPLLSSGRGVERDGEIVLDAAFAEKWGIGLGEDVRIQESCLRVVGLSGETNMLVIQYAFASLNDVRSLYGMNDLVSVYALRARPGVAADRLVDAVSADVPGVSVVPHEEFVSNNLREMESGFLPVLLVLAVVGTVALGSIVSLLLTLDVLERRVDLAVLKTIGAPVRFLPATIIVQAFVLAGTAFVIAAALALPLAAAVQLFTPEMAAILDAMDVLALAAGLLVVSLASTLVPLHRLAAIYPAEAFT